MSDVAPHGGALVDRVATPERAAALRAEAARLPVVPLDDATLSDALLIAQGAYSPLIGFMARSEVASVLAAMRLPSGAVWTLPILLPVPEEIAASIGHAERVALATPAGERVALLDVAEVFSWDREDLARQTFGTEDPAHPGAARLLAAPGRFVAGPLTLFENPHLSLPGPVLTPRDTRAAILSRGYRSVVGFQTRNPIHRAHEFMLKVALEEVDGLLVHPLVGATKEDDVPADVRVACYEALLRHYFPPERVLLSLFPAAMRYAGPREAIFHALVRKNYGCTHFIVGRDHAGVGNYYQPFAAQEIFGTFPPGDLGVTPLFFDEVFYCARCAGMASPRSCPHGDGDRLTLSGTEVRALLRAGRMPPPEFTRPEVARILLDAMRREQTEDAP